MEYRFLKLVRGIVAALAILLAAAPLQAVTNAEGATRFSYREGMRFSYWTECSPLRLAVAMSDDAVRMGLTEGDVTAAVRSRLRAARIYTDTNNLEVPLLGIYVGVANSKRRLGGAFSIDLSLYKHVYDPLTGLSMLAQTNDIHAATYAITGLHAGNAAFILSEIARAMDRFLDTYLRINGPACS